MEFIKQLKTIINHLNGIQLNINKIFIIQKRFIIYMYFVKCFSFAYYLDQTKLPTYRLKIFMSSLIVKSSCDQIKMMSFW